MGRDLRRSRVPKGARTSPRTSGLPRERPTGRVLGPVTPCKVQGALWPPPRPAEVLHQHWSVSGRVKTGGEGGARSCDLGESRSPGRRVSRGTPDAAHSAPPPPRPAAHAPVFHPPRNTPVQRPGLGRDQRFYFFWWTWDGRRRAVSSWSTLFAPLTRCIPPPPLPRGRPHSPPVSTLQRNTQQNVTLHRSGAERS